MKKTICGAICISLFLTGCCSNIPIDSTISTEVSTISTSFLFEETAATEVHIISPSSEEKPAGLQIQQENHAEPKATVQSPSVAAPVAQTPAPTPVVKKSVTIESLPQPKEQQPTIVVIEPEFETAPVINEILPIPEPSLPPITTDPPETTPSVPSETITETEPAVTAPPQCIHNWQRLDYPETGHYEEFNACGCGYRFSDISAYDTHVAQYTGTAEMFTVHGHWGTTSQWIVDAAGYSEWYCSTCGARSASQP